MRSVINDRSIAYRGVATAALKGGDAGQQSRAPGGTAICRPHVANIGSTPAENSPDLKARDHRVREGEAARLHLRAVLAARVRERVAAQFDQRHAGGDKE